MKILLLGSLAAMLLLSLSHGQDQPVLVVDGDDGDDAVPVNLQALRELKRSLQNDDINDDGNLQMALRGLRDEYADDNTMPEIQMALRGLEDGSDDDNSMPEIQMALRGLEDGDNSMPYKVALRQLDSAGAVTAPRKRFLGSLISKGIRGIVGFFRRLFGRRNRSKKMYTPYRSNPYY